MLFRWMRQSVEVEANQAFFFPHISLQVSFSSCDIIAPCLRGHGEAARDRLATQVRGSHTDVHALIQTAGPGVWVFGVLNNVQVSAYRLKGRLTGCNAAERWDLCIDVLLLLHYLLVVYDISYAVVYFQLFLTLIIITTFFSRSSFEALSSNALLSFLTRESLWIKVSAK